MNCVREKCFQAESGEEGELTGEDSPEVKKEVEDEAEEGEEKEEGELEEVGFIFQLLLVVSLSMPLIFQFYTGLKIIIC